MASLIIRQEHTSERKKVEYLIKSAFKDAQQSNTSEAVLVSKLRKSDAFIPELSLVADQGGEVVGHILLTKVLIDNKHVSLALAPVSVSPQHQNEGIGKQLILEAHRRAKDLGYKSIMLVGHKDYYPRFGYKQLSNYGIDLPFNVPCEYCMAVELEQGALKGVSGKVKYPDVWENSHVVNP